MRQRDERKRRPMLEGLEGRLAPRRCRRAARRRTCSTTATATMGTGMATGTGIGTEIGTTTAIMTGTVVVRITGAGSRSRSATARPGPRCQPDPSGGEGDGERGRKRRAWKRNRPAEGRRFGPGGKCDDDHHGRGGGRGSRVESGWQRGVDDRNSAGGTPASSPGVTRRDQDARQPQPQRAERTGLGDSGAGDVVHLDGPEGPRAVVCKQGCDGNARRQRRHAVVIGGDELDGSVADVRGQMV